MKLLLTYETQTSSFKTRPSMVFVGYGEDEYIYRNPYFEYYGDNKEHLVHIAQGKIQPVRGRYETT